MSKWYNTKSQERQTVGNHYNKGRRMSENYRESLVELRHCKRNQLQKEYIIYA